MTNNTKKILLAYVLIAGIAGVILLCYAGYRIYKSSTSNPTSPDSSPKEGLIASMLTVDKMGDAIFYFTPTGDYGQIAVGSYHCALYGDEREYDLSLDEYIDAEKAAPVYRLPSGVLYIADHNYQGFDAILTADELKIKTLDGKVKSYERVHYRECFTKDWFCTDGFDMFLTYPEGDLVTQTCIDNDNGVAFVIWKSQ